MAIPYEPRVLPFRFRVLLFLKIAVVCIVGCFLLWLMGCCICGLVDLIYHNLINDNGLFSYYFVQRCNAGMALDQPTIGKAFLMFTLMSTIAAPYVWIARKTLNPASKWQYAIFAGGCIMVTLGMLSALIYTACMVAGYVHAFGWTSGRFYGAVVVSVCAAGWIVWSVALLYKPSISRPLFWVALSLLSFPVVALVYYMFCYRY